MHGREIAVQSINRMSEFSGMTFVNFIAVTCTNSSIAQ